MKKEGRNERERERERECVGCLRLTNKHTNKHELTNTQTDNPTNKHKQANKQTIANKETHTSAQPTHKLVS